MRKFEFCKLSLTELSLTCKINYLSTVEAGLKIMSINERWMSFERDLTRRYSSWELAFQRSETNWFTLSRSMIDYELISKRARSDIRRTKRNRNQREIG